MKKRISLITLGLALILSICFCYAASSYGQGNTERTPSVEKKALYAFQMPEEDNQMKDVKSIEIAEQAEHQQKPKANSSLKKQSNKNKQSNKMSLLGLIQKGGIVGYLIIFLSIISMALIIDYSVTIRKSKIAPPKDIKMLEDLVQTREAEQMDRLVEGRPSFVTRVTIAGLKEFHLGYQEMIKAMEDTAESLSSSIARRTEHLNVIGNISPMLGLLGTVIGMLRCFNEIAHVPGAIEPKQLAGGIFEALITTCLGLIVAIPSLYAYSVFRNRVDEYTGEASLQAEQLISVLKPSMIGKK